MTSPQPCAPGLCLCCLSSESGGLSCTLALLAVYPLLTPRSAVLCVCSGKPAEGGALGQGGWQREVCLLLLARPPVDREREGHVGPDDGGVGRGKGGPGKSRRQMRRKPGRTWFSGTEDSIVQSLLSLDPASLYFRLCLLFHHLPGQEGRPLIIWP